METREDKILKHLYLVHRVARRFADSAGSISLESLRSAGTIGLIKAVDRFDPEQKTQFSSYAVPMITGEIKHYLRDRGWPVKIARPMKETIERINQVERRKLSLSERYPTVDELSHELEIPEEAILEALEARKSFVSVSYEEEPGEDRQYEYDSLQKAAVIPDRHSYYVRNLENRIQIKNALNFLPPVQQNVIILKFFKGMSQQQIALKINVSQMHVSRLLKKSLKALSAYL